jgi:hypothetical protein
LQFDGQKKRSQIVYRAALAIVFSLHRVPSATTSQICIRLIHLILLTAFASPLNRLPPIRDARRFDWHDYRTEWIIERA